MTTALIFYPTAIAIIIFALLAVFVQRVIRAIMAAVVIFFLTGLIFYLLGAEYNAVIQLAIYGLAVPILLAMALMFTNVRDEKNQVVNNPRKYIVYFSCGLIILSLIYLVGISFNIMGTSIFNNLPVEINSFRIFDAITDGFFKSYLPTFELVSILLLAIIVGVSDNAK